MKCKYCKKNISEEKIKKNTTIAVCPECWALFDINNRSYAGIVHKKIKCQEESNYLKITCSWFTWGDLLCFLGLIFLNLYAFNLIFYVISNPLLTILYPVIWFLTYFYLGRVFNRTILEVKDNNLSSSHKPVPWFENISFHSKDLQEIYSKEVRAKTMNYIVKGKLKDGKEVKLISFLQKPEDALFIEEKLKKYLKVKTFSLPKNN